MSEESARTVSSDKPPKDPIVVFYNSIYKLINGTHVDSMMGRTVFPKKFHVVSPGVGKYDVLEELDNGLVKQVDLDDVARVIAQFVQHELRNMPGYHFTPRQTRECALYWQDRTPPLDPSPRLFAEKSYAGLCYHRLKWDIEPKATGDAPLFNELMGRTSNSEALMAFIGSLFYLEADRQQYLWIYGQGQNGKSSLLNVLDMIFGPAFGPADTKKAKSPFFNSSFIGKRLIGFSDCDNYSFPTTDTFKALTGNDPVFIEQKYEKAFKAYLICKFIFLSNARPNLSSEMADLRRAIYCEMGAILGDADPQYVQKLFAEAPEFLGVCKAHYLDLCPGHRAIPVCADQIADIIAENESDLEYIFNKYFEVAAGDDAYVAPGDLHQILEDAKVTRLSHRREFLRYLDRKYGIKRTKVYLGMVLHSRGEGNYVKKQKTAWRYTGMKRREVSKSGWSQDHEIIEETDDHE